LPYRAALRLISTCSFFPTALRNPHSAIYFPSFPIHNSSFFLQPFPASHRENLGQIADVNTVKEIQAAIPKLSREEIKQIREWIDDYLEDQLELTDEVKAKLDQSRREIAAGFSR
jgi:hypothetical protein